MKEVAGQLRLDMAQFRELAAFAQFGSELDPATQRRLERGRRLTEILKQPQYEPVPLAEQVIVIYAGTEGYASEVPVEEMREYERNLLEYVRANHPRMVNELATEKVLTEETEDTLQQALMDFNASYGVA
jgi:F-type H+-transporting ATPase subunit alpha